MRIVHNCRLRARSLGPSDIVAAPNSGTPELRPVAVVAESRFTVPSASAFEAWTKITGLRRGACFKV